MSRVGVGLFSALAYAAVSVAALSAPADGIEIQTEDVTRFYKVYDAAGGHPTVEQLQHDYVDPGTEGLHRLMKARNVTAERIGQAIATRPELYTEGRICMAALPRVRERLNVAFRKLVALYPEAQKPPVTIVVGRGRPVAISGPGDGVQIGLEAMCAPIARFLNPNVDDRFEHVIAHEYIHSQQDLKLANDEHPTVLERSLLEGAAEFMGEMISGDVGYGAFRASTKGQEKEIETRFAADVDKTDLSDWLRISSTSRAFSGSRSNTTIQRTLRARALLSSPVSSLRSLPISAWVPSRRRRISGPQWSGSRRTLRS
jgi:hypothetical protein